MTSAPPCEPWLALVADDVVAASIQPALQAIGANVRCFASSTDLVRCSTRDAPQAVVLHLAQSAHEGASEGASEGAPTALHGPIAWDVPLLCVGPVGDASAAGWDARLSDSGAHHWLPAAAAMTPADWRGALAFARAAHRRDHSQRQRIASLQDQLAEQRVVARAKGLLMAAQGMTEEDAFGFLRSGAMQSRLPLADMARAVVDTAIWSDAVNRAGQLRWLSQRCIAAAAQRLGRIDPPAARRMQNDALKRARDILDGLTRLPLPDATRQAMADTDQAWRALQSCLDQRLDLGSLSLADSAAELALERAEALTGALQAVGSSPTLRVVNLCGRQRMRAQRLVKLGLLTRLGMVTSPDEGCLAEAAALVAAFASTLSALAALPLGSAEIATAHQLAVDRWGEMVQALQAGEMTALVRCGEALLVSVDALTLCWERSLQLVLG